ncbi:MAG: FAD-binding oxidoreductase [Terriglobia bacterium]
MASIEITNWFGDLVSHPQILVEANSKEDIIAILKDPVKYPSPVRAVGSNHSTTPCGVADGGTLVSMGNMNRILSITGDTVTAQAGAHYIDIAHELENHGLQLYVNTEIGSLSVGAAACAGTKDGSMPGEFGQVGSYVTNVKMVLPSGELLEVTGDQRELMQKVRSSYGLFGIVYEATFRVRPILPMAVYHETFTLEDFVTKLPDLWARNESMMFYTFPFDNLITVEFRKYNPGATGSPARHVWQLRNFMWGTAGPLFCHELETTIASPAVRYKAVDEFNALWRFKLTHLIKSDYTVATDQIIHYPPVSTNSRYTFSLWAFPEERYASVLPAYFKFSRDYYQQKGYRSNMLSVGYRIAKDQESLLSYSYDGTVMTVDPVSTGNQGWKPFLEAYNEFCSNLGGSALLNQTYGVTRAYAQKSMGDRLKVFAAARKQYDPGNRLLNAYFQDLLTE